MSGQQTNEFELKEWFQEFRRNMSEISGFGLNSDVISQLRLHGIFSGMKLQVTSDHSSQLLLKVAEVEMTEENIKQVIQGQLKRQGQHQLEHDTTAKAGQQTEGHGKGGQRERESTGSVCACHGLGGFHLGCECPLGQSHLNETRKALKVTKKLLRVLERELEKGLAVSAMYETVKKWADLANQALALISSFTNNSNYTGTNASKSTGVQSSTSTLHDSILGALCQHLTILAIAQVNALQLAWHSKGRETVDRVNFKVNESFNGSERALFQQPQALYLIYEKNLLKCDPPHCKVADRFRAYGLDPKFARYPILYVAWIWWSLLHSQENGDEAHGRCFAGLAESLGMCDWFSSYSKKSGEDSNTRDRDENGLVGSGLLSENRRPSHLTLWLALVISASADCYTRRVNLGDYAGAVRGLVGSAYLETKIKIEDSFEAEPQLMLRVLEATFQTDGGDRRPPFKYWITANMYDSGTCGMTCENVVNSLTTVTEVTSIFNLWNDILDYARDLACGETRSYVSLFVRGSSGSNETLYGQGGKVIAALFGGMEYAMKNEKKYGLSLSTSPSMIYAWHLGTGRYGLMKMYLTNLQTFVQDGAAHTPIRLGQLHLRRFVELYGQDFQPLVDDTETVRVSDLKLEDWMPICATYLNCSQTQLENLVNGSGNVNEGGSKHLKNEHFLATMAFDRGELAIEENLKAAGITHPNCKNILLEYLGKMMSCVGGTTVSLFALNSACAYLDHAGLEQPPGVRALCVQIHKDWSIMAEVFAMAALAGEFVCPACCIQYGEWVDMNACGLVAELEELISPLSYPQRLVAIRAVLGGTLFSTTYMKIPLLDLYWRANTAAVCKGQVLLANTGDKFTI